ncbi:hypothetical protein K431DRAFT_228165 [Polychaeton citri CBS 116435]|uniref:Cyclic-AMP phosphodiesterase n=1 Tax=Polychaeton citri CBS 116435 TaxID=1314669 RepID=A0A9P4UNE7_9PEZI|nr:hypothetical protein K431DRAFT_228165 [Polychaeton citri CBS 116435]
MKHDNEAPFADNVGLHGWKPTLQVVCLGSGGGPCEENVTGFLVRSIGSNWAKGSLLAVDAGSHLAPITRILERDFPSDSSEASLPEPTTLKAGPFSGLTLPHESARANALHVLRTYISTYLITHPHLDHLSGFAINTAAFHATSRPKTLAALPGTIDAVKRHIFNDVIWPNLTDEDGGVGFVTFQRLKEGGDVMVGEGRGRGYIDVSEGLGVRAFKVSHGVCTKSPPSHQHRGSIGGIPLPTAEPQLPFGSVSQDPNGRTVSISQNGQIPPIPTTPGGNNACVVDSTAFFIRDSESHREVLIFGDVEPDKISLCPRNHHIWLEAARKIAYECLGGILIECSYDDSQADGVLFGHLNPRHLVDELVTLGEMVMDARAQRSIERGQRKRKRSGPNGLDNRARHLADERSKEQKRSRSLAGRSGISKEARRGSAPDHTMIDAMSPGTPTSMETETPPLAGVKVVIIHIKDTMKDGPHASETILAQLKEHEARLAEKGSPLGCEFVISQSGESYWL